jgi:hypothetical protein
LLFSFAESTVYFAAFEVLAFIYATGFQHTVDNTKEMKYFFASAVNYLKHRGTYFGNTILLSQLEYFNLCYFNCIKHEAYPSEI